MKWNNKLQPIKDDEEWGSKGPKPVMNLFRGNKKEPKIPPSPGVDETARLRKAREHEENTNPYYNTYPGGVKK